MFVCFSVFLVLLEREGGRMTVSRHSLPRTQRLGSRSGVSVWVTFLTEMTRLIKGWPFAAGMRWSLRQAVLAYLSDLGLASWEFVWQIKDIMAPASAPLVSPSSLISSCHSVLPNFMSSQPFKEVLMGLCKHGWLNEGWTFGIYIYIY